MSSNKKPLQLPNTLHKTKLRFYKEPYPSIDDAIVAKINKKNGNIGYYMDMVEYEDKEALILFKEVSRKAYKKVVFNTFNNDTNYPVVVSEKQVHKMSNDESDEELDSDDEIDYDDESLNVKIGLTNKNLNNDEKKEVMYNFNRYKQIHTLFHNFGGMLMLSTLKTQEDIDKIKSDDYKKFLENLANNTLWKYPRDKIVDIFHEIRNNTDKTSEYFEFENPEHLDILKKAICKSIPKTKYTINCHIKMQTLDTEGINVIKNVLTNINKSGIIAQSISAPEYLLKLETGDPEKVKQKINDSLEETIKYMSEHLGFVEILNCNMSNNITNDIIDVKLPIMITE